MKGKEIPQQNKVLLRFVRGFLIFTDKPVELCLSVVVETRIGRLNNGNLPIHSG
jgi:hypothetical protein